MDLIKIALRSPAYVVLPFLFPDMCQKQLANSDGIVGARLVRAPSQPQRIRSKSVFGIYVSAAFEEKSYSLQLSLVCGLKQCRIAVMIAGIDLRAM